MGTTMKQIWILNGTARSGKDTFADIVEKWCITQQIDIEVHNISSIDLVRRAAVLLGWDVKKNDKGRKFLSDLKLLSSKHYDGPFKYVTEYIKTHEGIIFVHIREPDEITKIVKAIPETKTILISRDDTEVPNNMADKNVDKFEYDIYLKNDSSLEDYVKKIVAWCNDNIKNQIE